MQASDWEVILNEPGYEFGPPWREPVTGATDPELQELESWFRCPVPDDYTAFLRFSNGAEIRYRDLWTIRIWPSAEVPKAIQSGAIPVEVPDAVAFGSDFGDEILFFDMRGSHPEGQYPIYALDYLEVHEGWGAAICVAQSFRELLMRKRSLFDNAKLG